MIADIFTKALPGPAHKRHMDTLVSDLPQSIVEMTLSLDSKEPPEDRAVEEKDCKPTLEGSPSPEES